MKNLLITGDFDIPGDVLEKLNQVHSVRHLKVPTNYDDIARAIEDTEIYILGGPEYLDSGILERASRLKHVVVMGTGTSSFIDLNAAKRLSIRVDNTPGLNADSVAEFALGSILFLSAGGVQSWEELRTGRQWLQPVRKGLSDLKIGMIGMGNIGSLLAEKIRAVSPKCDIYYWSRNRKGAIEKRLGLTFCSLPEIFRLSNLCTVHLTYSPELEGLISWELLKLAQGNLKIFHYCNPRIIDSSSLLRAIQQSKVSFAFMDGYYREWVDNWGIKADRERLLSLGSERFVATSHIAALTTRAIEEILSVAVEIALQRKPS